MTGRRARRPPIWRLVGCASVRPTGCAVSGRCSSRTSPWPNRTGPASGRVSSGASTRRRWRGPRRRPVARGGRSGRSAARWRRRSLCRSGSGSSGQAARRRMGSSSVPPPRVIRAPRSWSMARRSVTWPWSGCSASTRSSSARPERREALASQRGLLRLRKGLHQVLQPLLRDRGLIELEQDQRFLIKRRRRLVATRVVGQHLPELLHRLLERLVRLLGLARIGVPAREREVRLADPVLRRPRERLVREAAQELAKAGDRERVAALAEVEVRRLIDVLWLERVGRRPAADGRRGRRRRGRGRGAGRTRWGRGGRRDGARLARKRLELAVDLVELAGERGERGERSRQRVHALRERGEAPLGFRVTVAALRLRQRGLRLAERTLGALLHERHVRPELEEILLGGDAGGVLNRRAAAEQQGGETKGAPSPRHGIQGYRGLTRKCARRFLLQHASLCSVHSGRSSP